MQTHGEERLEIMILIIWILYKLYSKFSGESKALRPPDNAVFENMIKGANCNCPMDCQDTVYTQEISQANMRPNSNIFNRLRVKPNYLWHLQDLMEKNSNNTKKVRKYNQTI